MSLGPNTENAVAGHSDSVMMKKYEIAVRASCKHWRQALPGIVALCRRAARATLRTAASAPKGNGEGVAAGGEVTIVLADDAFVRRLNSEYRGQDKPTNVLSFPAGEPEPMPDMEAAALGDVVIAFESVAREATAQKKRLDAHLSHMVVHGVLHLLGFDHEDEAGAGRMENVEIAVLAELGIGDPYAAGLAAPAALLKNEG